MRGRVRRDRTGAQRDPAFKVPHRHGRHPSDNPSPQPLFPGHLVSTSAFTARRRVGSAIARTWVTIVLRPSRRRSYGSPKVMMHTLATAGYAMIVRKQIGPTCPTLWTGCGPAPSRQ
jgi:hypothetical protein